MVNGRKILQIFIIGVALTATVVQARAQRKLESQIKAKPEATNSHVTSSPAFAEMKLKQVEYQAEFDSLSMDYTPEFPKIQELQNSLSNLAKEFERINRVKAVDAGRLSIALGKLMIRKVELETELWSLLQNYKEGHPDVKRKKRQIEIYEAAIKDILGQ